MRVLFCNIAWMNYYKGIIPGVDEPYGGGSYVLENQDAHEKYNFDPLHIELEDGTERDACFGFTETKTSKSGKRQDLHIEKIEGCEACAKEDFVEDVTVIYCAAGPYQNFTSVVGWYRRANVYRQYQELIIPQPDGTDYYQYFNAEALRKTVYFFRRKNGALPSGVYQEGRREHPSDSGRQMCGLRKAEMRTRCSMNF